MNFDFNEEQTMIMDGIARYIREEYDFDRRRSIIESDSACSDDVWRQFSELGWLSIPFDESYGGFGGHADDLAGVMLELGKGLIIEPYMSTVVVFGSLLNASNNDSLKEQLIPRIINGQYKGSFAYAEEQSRFEISDVKTSAQKCGDGYKLNGTKIAVIDAKESDGLIVTARTGGSQYGAEGISLFLVDTSAEGVAVSSYNTMDSHSSSTINLENVFVTEANLIVDEGEGFRHIESCLPQILLCLSAEALGIMEVLNKLTVEYSKTRKQFGAPIGSFQALQHRMVDNFMAFEQSKSMMYRGICESTSFNKNDIDINQFLKMAHAVKALVAKNSKQIGDESIQIHGGIGMTDELNIGHFVKRLMMINVLFGDGDFHRQCFSQN